ncbi:hypothetical protein ZPR_4694 [Zunongwangia profunda SM-A87]|uniref:Uncharacterized protein n=1 Tax=Zunongwangia profunda (strain DSM 18752 / CCTCC AB 206139 / SM-A87) TaxID=655815 RepID=D5BEK8_ZUNPS|nr:hypothetical protein ZPR_4694 [Zunongwangia profunda SM-A87]
MNGQQILQKKRKQKSTISAAIVMSFKLKIQKISPNKTLHKQLI